MRLVTSLTIDASLLRKLLRLWDEGGDPRNPFAAVLVTPLFASPSTLRLIREELKEKRGSIVYFDSGGYYAQQGKISFDDLYRRLRDYYRDPDNQWADWYVLPDHVPTSEDDQETIEFKVRDTVSASKNFLCELPLYLRRKTIPVIQGHTAQQLEFCAQQYQSVGARYVGFGSFDTCGPNQSINRITFHTIDLLKKLGELALHYDLQLHLFGIGTPPAFYLFDQIRTRSFDSLTWLKAAGYGHIFLPFTRGYRITHQTTKRAYMDKDEFIFLKELTGHSCPFCTSYYELTHNRLYRILHNLVCLHETVQYLREWDTQRIQNIISLGSPTYTGLIRRMEDGAVRISRLT